MKQKVKCYLCRVLIDMTVEDYEELPIFQGKVVWARLGSTKELVCIKCYEENIP